MTLEDFGRETGERRICCLRWTIDWMVKGLNERSGVMKLATMLAVIVLGAISVGHILRLLLAVEVTVGGMRIPIWMSVAGFIFAGALATALWLENRPKA